MTFNILRQCPSLAIDVLFMQYRAHLWDILHLQEAGPLPEGLRGRGVEDGAGLAIVWSSRFSSFKRWHGSRPGCLGVAFDLMDGCRHLFIDVHLPTTMHTLEEFTTAICDVDDLYNCKRPRVPRGAFRRRFQRPPAAAGRRGWQSCANSGILSARASCCRVVPAT